VRSIKGNFRPPVARLRSPSSGSGILNGSNPLGECMDPNSDRVRCRCFPVGHLFFKHNTEKMRKTYKKRYGNACRGVRIVLLPMPMLSCVRSDVRVVQISPVQ